MTKLYAQRKDVFDIDKVTVVGSPTITSDGVASGFSNENYLKQLQVLDFSKEIKFHFSCVYKSSTRWQRLVTLGIGYIVFNIAKNLVIQPLGTADGRIVSEVLPINEGDNIELEITISNAIRKFKFKNITTGITVSGENTTAITIETINQFGIPIDSNNFDVWAGSIDLNSFKIYVDGELVYSPTKPVYALERRKPTVWNKGQFTIVGNPSISESGVASGFGRANNFIQIPFTFNTTSTYKIQLMVKTPSNPITNGYLFGGDGQLFEIYCQSNAFDFYYKDNRNKAKNINKYGFQPNTKYHIYCEFNLSTLNIAFGVKKDGDTDYQIYSTVMSSYLTPATITNLGNTNNQYSIDLKQFKIYTDNNLVFDGGADTYVYDPSKFTVVGSPTITEYGVASGFSGSNYLTVPNKILQKIGQKPFEIKVKFSNIPMFAGTVVFPSVLGNMVSAVENRTNITLSRNNQNPYLFLEANFTDGTHTTIGYTTNIPATLTDVEYSLIFDGSTYTVKALANGVQLPFVRGGVSTEGKFIDWGTEDLFIGIRSVGASFDLKQLSITVDGKEVFTGAKEKYYAMRGGM